MNKIRFDFTIDEVKRAANAGFTEGKSAVESLAELMDRAEENPVDPEVIAHSVRYAKMVALTGMVAGIDPIAMISNTLIVGMKLGAAMQRNRDDEKGPALRLQVVTE